jgi:organic hydroperoxide reductase OsmC/OhrA
MTHRYQSHLLWEGSTGVGYRDYRREHRVRTPPAAAGLVLSSDPSFRGDPSLTNPEQLLLAAASSCQLLSFLAVAARAGVDVLSYEDDAEAFMPEDVTPVRITRIVLRPHVVVGRPTEPGEVHRLLSRAHDDCYVANTLNAELVIEATVVSAVIPPSGQRVS